MFSRLVAGYSGTGSIALGLGLLIACAPAVLAESVGLGRDPTRPPPQKMVSAQADSAVTPLALDSIVYSATRRVAVINQSVVAEGDVFRADSVSPQGRVLEISPDSVVVVRDGEKTRLHLPQSPEVRRVRTQQ